MTTKEKIAVMQAFVDGKKIEYKGACTNYRWLDADVLAWDWNHFDYRIKSEPKYRPYANAEEFLRDSKKHNNWFCTKDKQTFHMASSVYNNFEKVYAVGHGFSLVQYSLFNDYMWENDGSPCGVLEQ